MLENAPGAGQPFPARGVVSRRSTHAQHAARERHAARNIIHKSRVTLAWMAEFGDRLRLHFLPRYCPNENRIERIWLDLHANVTRNHRQKAIGALLDRVHGYLAERFDTSVRSCEQPDAESLKAT